MISNKIIEWLISILESNGNDSTLNCYEYWQNMGDKNIYYFEKFIAEQRYIFSNGSASKCVMQDFRIEKDLNITYAPRIFFNNKVLPIYYTITDIFNLCKRL
jgi:hypothetical protein